MASIETRIDNFLAQHEIDTDIKDELCALVTGCMEDLFKHVFNTPIPSGSEPKKAKKVLQAEKIEDPASVQNKDELRNCTTGILNQFCKDSGLKVGGNKKEIMDRVWRHIQGESSDDDKSSRNKPKESKKVPEKHVCSGKNLAGVPCGSSGSEEYGGCFFCWRHIEDAAKFIEATEAVPKEVTPTKESAPEPVTKSKVKASKAQAEPKAVGKPSKGKKKVEPEPTPELEEDDE